MLRLLQSLVAIKTTEKVKHMTKRQRAIHKLGNAIRTLHGVTYYGRLPRKDSATLNRIARWQSRCQLLGVKFTSGFLGFFSDPTSGTQRAKDQTATIFTAKHVAERKAGYFKS